MKRPAKVKILGKVIRVSYVPAGHITLRDHPADDEPGLGRSDGLKQTIAIEDRQPLASEQDCVLHEVLHHIEYAMKMDIREEIVEKFASGLLAVMKDNPGLVKYLLTKEA